tara:strand:- start:138 stop:317 length:180 start_codon:yes stop_codon:yes gene_type:complete
MVAAACKVITKKILCRGLKGSGTSYAQKKLARKKNVDIFSGIFLPMIIVAFISFIIFMG